MRNNSGTVVPSYLKPFVGCVIYILLAVVGCRKSDTNESINSFKGEISSYLESQKFASTNPSAATVDANRNIDLLKNNLDFSLATTERLDEETNLVVIPVKNRLVAEKNLDKVSILTLLLITNNEKKIISSNIVYFLPADQNKRSVLPENTFSNLLGGKEVALDGIYKMLTLSGRWLSQFTIKNKKLSSVGTVEKKKTVGDNSGRTNTCTNWYLITTIYWVDGSVTRTEEYIGTTCGDNCGGNGGYATVCGVEPEESGGGSDVISSEEDASTTDSDTAPSASLTGDIDLDADLLKVRYQAVVTYTYDQRTKTIITISGGQPSAIPVSQPFIDDNGNPAVLYNSARSCIFTATPLSYNSRYAHWAFVAVYNYVYTTGSFILPKNKYIAKVVTAG